MASNGVEGLNVAAIPRRRPRIHNGLIAVEVTPHGVELCHSDQRGGQWVGGLCRHLWRNTRRHSTTCRLPCRHATIEDGNRFMPTPLHHPPCATAKSLTITVIDHHLGRGFNPPITHGLCKVLSSWQGVAAAIDGALGVMRAQVTVKIGKYRACDMGRRKRVVHSSRVHEVKAAIEYHDGFARSLHFQERVGLDDERVHEDLHYGFDDG